MERKIYKCVCMCNDIYECWVEGGWRTTHYTYTHIPFISSEEIKLFKCLAILAGNHVQRWTCRLNCLNCVRVWVCLCVCFGVCAKKIKAAVQKERELRFFWDNKSNNNINLLNLDLNWFVLIENWIWRDSFSWKVNDCLYKWKTNNKQQNIRMHNKLMARLLHFYYYLFF